MTKDHSVDQAYFLDRFKHYMQSLNHLNLDELKPLLKSKIIIKSTQGVQSLGAEDLINRFKQLKIQGWSHTTLDKFILLEHSSDTAYADTVLTRYDQQGKVMTTLKAIYQYEKQGSNWLIKQIEPNDQASERSILDD